MSTYNNNIPQATDRLKDSQGSMLGNFQSIATLVAVNHAPFNSSNQGKHNFVEMPVQSPVPTTVAGEVGLYCQTSPLTGVPALVFAPQSAGTPVEFTSSLQAANGWSRLPSGILLKWGQATAANGTATITFPTGANIPVFSVPPFQVFLTPFTFGGDTDSFSYVFQVFTTNFTVVSVKRTSLGSSGNFLSYLAIGI